MIYYSSTDCGSLGQHIPACCGNDELARVSSVLFIHKTALAAIQADPTNATVWLAQISAGKIHVIPNTSGSYAASEKTSTGYGRQAMKMQGYEHKVSYKDPDYSTNNSNWYNELKRSNRYYPCYVTETMGHIGKSPCTTIPKPNVADDITQKVVYEVDVVWNHEDFAVPFVMPQEVIDCFLVAAA